MGSEAAQVGNPRNTSSSHPQQDPLPMCSSAPKQQTPPPPPPPPATVAPLANPEDLSSAGPNSAAKGRRKLSIAANAPQGAGLAV